MKKIRETWYSTPYDPDAEKPVLTTNMVRLLGKKMQVDWNKIKFDDLYYGIKYEKNKDVGDEDLLQKDWLKYAEIAFHNLTKNPHFYDTVEENINNKSQIKLADLIRNIKKI